MATHQEFLSDESPPSPPPTLPEFPDTPSSIATLVSEDARVAASIVDWLCALGVVTSDVNFDDVASTCIPLCTLFSQIAPQLLPPDAFLLNPPTSGPNASRNLRYNIRHLARALVSFFSIPTTNIPSCTSSASSDVSANSDDASAPDFSAIISASSATSPRLSPPYVHALLTVLHNQRLEHVDVTRTVLILAECVLSAAISSPSKDTFIGNIMNLSERTQETLARSISRSTQSSNYSPSRPPLHATPVGNDENMPTVSAESINTAVTNCDDRLTAATGIPLADYKALAAERDSLRRRLAATDAQRTQLLDVETNLRKNLDDALDRLRVLEGDKSNLEIKVAEKGRALNEVSEALRISKVCSEELDSLRVKAQSAEDLEASLKRASKRLEEMASIRQINKDLQAEISAFRDNEARMSKHTEYLEAQLARSSQRANQLNTLADTLTSDLSAKENRFIDLHDENDNLKRKLEAVTQQLEIAMLQSTASKAATTTATYSAAPSADVPRKASAQELRVVDNRDVQTEDQIKAPVADTIGSEAVATTETETATDDEEDDELFEERAKQFLSDALLDTIGVHVGWEDVIECMRGVMDAMQDMQQGEELEQRGAVASECVPPSPRDQLLSGFIHASAGELQRLRASHPNLLHRSSQQSGRSDIADRTGETESDAHSRLSFIPEFGEMDAKVKATNSGDGDEFDFAANHCNVTEIPAGSSGPPLLASEGPLHDEYDDESATVSRSSSEATADSGGEGSTLHDVSHSAHTSQSASNGNSQKNSDHPRTSAARENGSTSPCVSAPNLKTQFGSDGLPARNGLNEKTRLSLTIRGESQSTSRSETTSMIARQTRSDLRALQEAMEEMRMERQACASVSSLVQKLDSARLEIDSMRKKILETEAESASLRREMNLILKEMDGLTVEKKVSEENVKNLLKEKERLVTHLEESLRMKEEEVREVREKYETCRQDYEKARNEERATREKLDSAQVIERAQQVELARLRAQLESNDVVSKRLNSVMQHTEGLSSAMSREQESRMQDALEAAQRDKKLAEEARDEARRVARTHASMLEGMKASTAAAAMARSLPSEERHLPATSSRKNLWFSEFWKKLLHRDRTQNDMSMSNVGSTRGSSVSASAAATPGTVTPAVATLPSTSRKDSKRH